MEGIKKGDTVLHTCDNCLFLGVDNSSDQTGPSIWCVKNHFHGIGSKEEQDALSEPNDCADFLESPF